MWIIYIIYLFITVSDLRIILLGKSLSHTSLVGNLIMGRAAFETEDPSHSVELHCESVRGHVEQRYITIIKTPNLFDPQFSQEKLSQKIKECISFSAPGPHAFLLVVQSYRFTENDRTLLSQILQSFSDQAMKYSIVIDTDSKTDKIDKRGSEAFHNLTKEIKKTFTYEQLLKEEGKKVEELLKMIDKKVKKNGGDYLSCDVFEEVQEQPTSSSREPLKKKRAFFEPLKKTLGLKESVEQHGNFYFSVHTLQTPF